MTICRHANAVLGCSTTEELRLGKAFSACTKKQGYHETLNGGITEGGIYLSFTPCPAMRQDPQRIGPDPRELLLPSSAHSGSEVGETPGVTPSVDKAHAENIGSNDRTPQGT